MSQVRKRGLKKEKNEDETGLRRESLENHFLCSSFRETPFLSLQTTLKESSRDT